MRLQQPILAKERSCMQQIYDFSVQPLPNALGIALVWIRFLLTMIQNMSWDRFDLKSMVITCHIIKAHHGNATSSTFAIDPFDGSPSGVADVFFRFRFFTPISATFFGSPFLPYIRSVWQEFYGKN
jgi:hypothetical protein